MTILIYSILINISLTLKSLQRVMGNLLFFTFCFCFLTLKIFQKFKYLISCWRPSQGGGAGEGWIIYEARALGSVFRDILPFFWDKYTLQFETNIFRNLRQINFAIWDKYILQYKTNTFCNLKRTFCNLRQIYFKS